MKEFEVIKEALDIANQRGCFNLDQSARVAHCLGVVGAKLAPSPPPQVEGKPTNLKKK